MEAHWERRNDFVALTLAEATELLCPFGIAPRGLALLSEGKVNTNYRVESVSGPYALRLHHGADHVVGIEAAIASELSNTLPVPRLVGRGQRFLVYEWKTGVSLERSLIARRDLPYDKIARNLGSFRKALNGYRYDSAGFFG